MNKAIIKCLLATLVLFALGGCFQMHSVTTIYKDGSGTASITLSLSAVLTEAMADSDDALQAWIDRELSNLLQSYLAAGFTPRVPPGSLV